MTDYAKAAIPPEKMIQTSDLAEAVRFLLKLTPGCVVPEIAFEQPADGTIPDVF